MIKFISFILLFLSFSCTSFSQVKNTKAVLLTSSIRIDGSLQEAAWNNAPVASDFITNSPEYGLPATFKTEVRILYDNSSLYIGAQIFDDPAKIRKQFTPRDNESFADVDYFAVFIDTYKDRQNAYQFLVTSRNVQSDSRVSPTASTDFGVYGDLSWDAVWDSKTSFNEKGWVVEIKIPFSSIRFSRQEMQEWGIQFLQFSRRLNETAFWNPVNPNVNGFVNQFGDVSGFNKLIPPLRLSFSPYVSGGYRSVPSIADGRQNEWLKSGGMDVKYGISESFTIDATLIPDFGQVISDNVINNISPFEIQFRENRPFFTEGTELFNKSAIFYSRRIGRTPSRFESIREETKNGELMGYQIIKNPEVTRLYNAIKFSGRTRGNLGIGLFNAITQPVKARLRHKITGNDSILISEPLSNYNVFVLDQALKNRSYITFTNTNVLRNGNERDANVSAVDVALYDKDNRFGIILRPRYSKIFDSSGGYDGFKNYLMLGKVSGKLQYSISNEIESDKYDPNDLGFLNAPNEILNTINASYNIFTPTKRFLNQRYSILAAHSYLYKPFEYQKTEIKASAFVIFKNFWDITLRTEIIPTWYNDFFELQTPTNVLETPRRKLRRPPNYFVGTDGSTDSRKRWFISWDLGFAETPLKNDPFWRFKLGGRYRFSDKFSLQGSFERFHDHGQWGYSFLRDGVTGAPILARRQYTDVESVVSGIYNFTSRMNITFRARHFWNAINNTNLYNVTADGNWTERLDLEPGDYNINYNAFNLDMFYTWDFRLGSRLIVGWKNWLGREFEYYINGNLYRRYSENAENIFSTPHGNEVTVRFIYFLDYLQLKK